MSKLLSLRGRVVKSQLLLSISVAVTFMLMFFLLLQLPVRAEVALLAQPQADSPIMLLEANLTAVHEVPAVDSIATGRAIMALVTDTLYYRVTVADIDQVVAAHIHEGAPGVNGNPIITLFNGGTFDASNPISGSVVLASEQITKLLAGGYYINVHTSDNPNGEIRGQIHAYTPASTYNALLLGQNEVPAVETASAGVAQFTLVNTDTLHFALHISGIVSITAAHIHRGAPGVIGDPIHPLYTGNGLFDATHPVSGSVMLSGQDMVDLLTGYLYVNVHSSAHPGGEIRGQIGGVHLFQAPLTGAEETPPHNLTATGRAVLALDNDGATLAYRVIVNDLYDITASHIHKGVVGVAGPPVFTLFNKANGGLFDPENPISGTVTLTVGQVIDLITEQYYINVHNPAFQSGALRGQVRTLSVPDHMLAPLVGDGEVPAVATDALGIARFTLNAAIGSLHYSVWITDIVDVTASHIHLAPVGVSGGIIFPLYTGGGLFDPTHPVGGAVRPNAKQWVDLLTGYYYVNVHSNAHRAGEIRGQIGGARLFRATLEGRNEVPPVTTSASGAGFLALNSTATALDYRVLVNNIENVTASHIHHAAVGVNGSIVFPLFTDQSPGVFDPSHPVSGTIALSTPQVFHLLSDTYYINVHTTQNRSGEIRGQVLAYQPFLKFEAMLDGAHENPPVATTANGAATLQLDAEQNLLFYTVIVTDIVGTTASHIHLAPVGVNGNIIFPLFNATAGGSFDRDHPVGGWLPLSGKNMVDLLTGYYYVNIHTDTNRSGEIRGQIVSAHRTYLPAVSH
ncbi:MAG: CHRD domain-containing protein [Caldilineaceae bacterium]